MARTADAVIIGAGVMGASIAFHLAERGVRPLVLEQRQAASGSTGKSAAFIRMHYTNEAEARLAHFSFPYFREWEDRVGYRCGFQRTGFLCLVGPADAGKLERNVAMLQRIGVQTEAVAPGALRGLQSGLSVDDLGAAAWEPQSGYADPVATTHALLRRARERGARLEEGERVEAIRLDESGNARGVQTRTDRIDSPAVFSAAGCWSPGLLATAGVAVAIRPVRAQLAFFARPPAPPELLTFIDVAGGVYARPHGAELVLAGVGTGGQEAADPNRYREESDPDFVDQARGLLARRLPPMEHQPFVRGHAGLYDMSPDTRAILDQAPGANGLFFAVGFSGTGFKIAPAVGAGLAEWLTEGRPRSVDFQPFRLGRFSEGQPLESPDEYRVPERFGHRI